MSALEPVYDTKGIQINIIRQLEIRVFNSPITRKGIAQREERISECAKNRLLFMEVPSLERLLDVNDLSDTYGYDFEQCISQASYLQIAIRTTINKIESYLLSARIKNSEAKNIRVYISQLLKEGLNERTLALLGLIYFYLDTSNTVPPDFNLEEFRLDEIRKEIALLQSSAAPDLPLGIIAYLLRTFCTVIIDSKGNVNLGGVSAAKRLLLGSLSKYFSEDHMWHIAGILEQLQLDPNFVFALEKPISCLNKNMASFVRIDLKLPVSAVLTAQHIQIACLLMLLHDLRQFHHPNCYAIAPCIYTLRTYPAKIVNKIKEYLMNGFITLESKIRMPIFILFYYRLLDDRHMNVYLEAKKLCDSSAVYAASRAMGIDLSSVDDRLWSVESILQCASIYTENPEHSFLIASLVLGSFKKNALQEMLVGTLEFLETNKSVAGNELLPNGYIKNRLLQHLKQIAPNTNKSENSEFLDAFAKKLAETLWLQNVNGKLCQSNKTCKVIFGLDAIAIPNFPEKTIEELEKIILNCRRFLCVLTDQILVIHTVTDLVNVLLKTVDDVVLQRKNAKLTCDILFIDQLKNAFTSDALKKQLAYFLASEQMSALNAKNYYESGLFIFGKGGGGSLDVPLNSFTTFYQTQTFFSGDPDQNFLNLFEYLSSLPSKEKFQSLMYPILCKSVNHVFLLHPYKFYKLIEFGPKIIFAEHCINPLFKLLKKTISLEQMQNVFSESDEYLKRLFCWPSPNSITVEQFIAFIFNSFSAINAAHCTKVMHALEKQMTLIPCGSMDWHAFLKKLPAPPSNDLLNQIVAQIQCDFANKSKLQPHEIAYYLQITLKAYGKLYSKVTLENFLRAQYELPLVWVVGDLNSGTFVESPDHAELVIKVIPHRYAQSPDISTTFGYFMRKGVEEKILPLVCWESLKKLKVIHY